MIRCMWVCLRSGNQDCQDKIIESRDKYKKMESDHSRKLIIHQILNQHGFYRLPLLKLLEILRLLEMPQVREAKKIQDNTFNGLIKLIDKLKLPQHRSKTRRKKYFTETVASTVSIEIKDYMIMIIDELLQNISQGTEAGKLAQSSFKKPIPPLYPPMLQPNSLGYPTMDFNSNAVTKNLQNEMEELMKMQMQMYYMSMYSYSNHPQMNMKQAYTQNYEKIQEKGQQKIQQKVQMQQQQQLKPQQKQIQQQQQQKQQKQKSKSKQTQRQKQKQKPKQKYMQMQSKKEHLDQPQYIQKQLIVEQKKNVNIQIKTKSDKKEQNNNKTKKKKQSKQGKLWKRKPTEQLNKPTPLKQSNANPWQGIMKLVAQQVQIQTDLSLLNEEIQLFPKNSHNAMAIKQELKKLHEQDAVNQQIIKIQQMQEQEKYHQRPTKVSQKVDDYIITINKDYLRDEIFSKLTAQESLPQLKSKSSQLLAFQKELQELSVFKYEATIEDNLKDCLCKATKKETQDCFDCLSCKRMFHSSCLRCPNYLHIQVCHICKMFIFDPINQAKETIGFFYIPDIRRSKFQAELQIAQYDYFLSKKIRAHQLEMRCFRLNNLQFNDITWPDEVGISINNKPLVEIHGLDVKSSLKKRKDQAIILTDFIASQNRNSGDFFSQLKIKIEMLSAPRQDYRYANNDYLYFIGVYFIERIQVQTLYNKFTQNLQNYKVDFISNLMNGGSIDQEQQVYIEKIACSLYDPFTRNLINTPVRGNKCLHGQCFDLKTYLTLMYAMKNRQWKCPICAKQAKVMYLDKDLAQLIKRSLQDKTIPNEIIFMKDGRILLKIKKDQEAGDDETPPLIKQLRKKAKTIEKIKPSKKIEVDKKDGQIKT